ncbi:hypothetical protein ABVT39_015654 [Epinephelus coioides]
MLTSETRSTRLGAHSDSVTRNLFPPPPCRVGHAAGGAVAEPDLAVRCSAAYSVRAAAATASTVRAAASTPRGLLWLCADAEAAVFSRLFRPAAAPTRVIASCGLPAALCRSAVNGYPYGLGVIAAFGGSTLGSQHKSPKVTTISSVIK